MKNRAFSVKISWGFLFMVFLLPACGGKTPPVKYYTLNTLPVTQQENPGAVLGEDIAVGVGPVDFPKFLDRPQIVTRKGQNRVEVSEFHRWAGSFPGDFSRVLARNISTLLPSNRVEIYPWADTFSPIYQVKLEVEQFDGQLGERVLLKVTWSLVDQEGKNDLVVQKSLIEESVSSEDYDGLVEAKNNALGSLSQAIVDEIRKLRQ
jgi:uncharacterized lipoprotein YmbA